MVPGAARAGPEAQRRPPPGPAGPAGRYGSRVRSVTSIPPGGQPPAGGRGM